MSGGSYGWRRVRQWIGALALGLSLIGGLAAAADKVSSPQDLARFVSVTRSLEEAPLRPDAPEDRKWAVTWLTEAPDVSVNICADVLKDVLRSKNAYSAELVGQYMFGVGASAIEHPEMGDEAQQLAGLESTLKAYRSIVRDQPKARTTDFDGLLKVQADGNLPAYVHKAFANCAAKT